MDFIENIVIGSGVLGLATAREFQKISNVLLIESNQMILNETSSRNSEVIHSGIYYSDGSLKNKFCIEGRDLLYSYLNEKNINFIKCGKIIISDGSSNEDSKLEMLISLAQKKSINYEALDEKQIIRDFQYLKAKKGIFIKDSGIFDSHSYGLSMLRDFEDAGGLISYKTEVDFFENNGSSYVLHFKNSKYKISCKKLIICAGLSSLNLLEKSSLEMPIPTQTLSKGDYFSYSGKLKINKLIYPVPQEHSLGLHLTPGLDGRIKFGPDATFVDKIDYRIEHNKIDSFIKQINKYIPSISKKIYIQITVELGLKLKWMGKFIKIFIQ